MSLSPEETIRDIVLASEAIKEEDKDDIAIATTSLYLVRASSELGLSEFVEDITEAVGESEHEELLKIPEETIENSKPYLVNLLGSDSLFASAKASLLIFESPNVFTESRLMTEARAIFGDDAREAPRAAILIHSLKIQYLHNRRAESYYVSLETQDLQKLIDVLERAKKKAENLKATLEKASVSLLERE